MTKPSAIRVFIWLVLFGAVALLLYQFRFADVPQILGSSDANAASNRNSLEKEPVSHSNSAPSQSDSMAELGSSSLTSDEKHAVRDALERAEDCFRAIEQRNAVVAFEKSNETYSMVIMRIRAPEGKDIEGMMDIMSQQLPTFEKSHAAENVYRESVTNLYNAYTNFPLDRPYKVLLLTVACPRSLSHLL